MHGASEGSPPGMSPPLTPTNGLTFFSPTFSLDKPRAPQNASALLLDPPPAPASSPPSSPLPPTPGNVHGSWKRVGSGRGNRDSQREARACRNAFKTELKGSEFMVKSVAFSPCGLNVASGSYAPCVLVYSLMACSVVHRLNGHTKGVRSVCYSPSGDHLVSGSDDQTVILWDTSSGSAVSCLRGHTDMVISVSFSSTGAHICSGSSDKTVIVWSQRAAEKLFVLEGHRDSVLDLQFSPDSKSIVSSSSVRATSRKQAAHPPTPS